MLRGCRAFGMIRVAFVCALIWFALRCVAVFDSDVHGSASCSVTFNVLLGDVAGRHSHVYECAYVFI